MTLKKTNPNIIVICGPTGIGKTSTAIWLATKFKGEIISADSMQIYRYMDIGTAKPTFDEQKAVPHYIIDVADPDEPFDAARFADIAHEKIEKICQKKMAPFVVGGTGLYIKALTKGLFRIKPADSDALKFFQKQCDERGVEYLYDLLKQKDPKASEKIHPNDAFRIIRALEVYETTGKPISQYHKEHQFANQPYNVLKIGLHMDRELLYERINKRVDIMLDLGLLEEVKKLLEKGYSKSLKSMQSIGYRHMILYLDNKLTWDESVELLKRDTRRYAKRQLTWFRHDPDIIWVHVSDIDKMSIIIENFLKKAL